MTLVPMTSPESALKALERLQAEGVYVLFARERQAGWVFQSSFRLSLLLLINSTDIMFIVI